MRFSKYEFLAARRPDAFGKFDPPGLADSQNPLWTKLRKWAGRFDPEMEASFLVEHDWAKEGMPYCKVYPRMCQLLADVDLSQIPADQFEMPFKAFEICLPFPLWPGSMILERDHCELVKRDPETGSEQKIRDAKLFHLLVHFGDKQGCFRMIDDGPTLQSAIDRMFNESKTDGESREFICRCWRIAISTALFMTNKHQLVLPDLEPRLIRNRPHTGKGRKSHFRHHSASLTLGREIELPTPIRSDDPTDLGTGHELSHSHSRRAHLRYQAFGEGRKDRKLIFVMPTIVRPDLPPSLHRRGYFIPDRSIK
jgi:hypothetical protein